MGRLVGKKKATYERVCFARAAVPSALGAAVTGLQSAAAVQCKGKGKAREVPLPA